VIAGNQKERGMLAGVTLKRPCEPFPKIRGRFRIVEYITGAEYCADPVAAGDIEDRRDDIHTCPR
jgi:hypothetical protein